MFTNKWVIFNLLLSVVLLNSAVAQRQWNFQRIDDAMGQPIGSGNTAIAMRSGSAWPVVATNTAVAAMVPGGWVKAANGFSSLGFLDGATSPDGRSIAFAAETGEVLTFSSSGWNRSIASAGWNWQPSVAFTNNNNPAILGNGNNGLTLSVQNGSNWISSSLGVWAERSALAYDSYNQANVVYTQGGQLMYATKGILTNNSWAFTDSQQSMFLPSNNSPLDLELNSNDVPFVIYNTDLNLIACSSYDRQQGKWNSSLIGPSSDYNYTMSSDSLGGIGIAYVTNNMEDGQFTIGFSYINGNKSWSTNSIWDGGAFNNTEGLPSLMPEPHIGLAFDEANNPVISFTSGNGVYIAYDPVIVPEPATAAILLLGGVLIRRIRKSS